jgi:hypothetical protein
VAGSRDASAAYRADYRLNTDRRARLRRLSPDTRYAIKAAFIEWVQIAQAEGYEPITGWANFLAEVDHSALLARLLNGDRPFAEKPPTRHSYPDYDAMEAS